MVAVVLDKVSGQTSTVPTGEISLSNPSRVTLSLTPADIASTARSGSDLIINLANGEQIRIDDFFAVEGDKRSELVLEDGQGNVWSAEYTDVLAEEFEAQGAVDQLAGAAGAGGASGLGVLAPLGLLGAVAAAAGAGGSGGNDGGGDPGNPGGPGNPDAPGAPTIRLGNGDSLLNAQETANGTVTVTVDLTGTRAAVGDTLTVNGTTITLTADNIAAGIIEVTVPAPADGETLTVNASLTDANGNTSPLASVSAVVDSTAPGTPTVTVGDGDGVISGSDVSNGLVTVRVGLNGSGAVTGDTLTVNGTAIVLTAAQIAAGTVETTVPVPADGQTLTVSATLTDAAGNVSPAATLSFPVDTTAPAAPGVTLGNGDPVITGDEINNGAVTIRVDLAGTGAVAGDTVVVNGTSTLISAAQIAAGFLTTTVAVPGNGQPLDVSVSLQDAAGNSSAPTVVSAVVDADLTTAPGVTVGNGDAYINAAEVAGGTVSVSVSLANTGALAGNILTVNGNPIALTSAQVAAGVVVTTLPAPADGTTFTVTASLSDGAGNTSPTTTITALVDTTAPALPGLILGDGTGPVGAGEIAGGSVTVSVNLAGTGAVAGDTLTVNGVPVTLTDAQIQAGLATVPVTAPADGATLFVTATLTDVAGNASPIATASALIDTTAPGQPTVTLGGGGGFLGPDDIVGGVVTITVNLAGTGATAGDRLTINGNTVVLTNADITAGTVTTTAPAPAEGATLTVTTSLADAAGNALPATTVTAVVDTTPPVAPSVTLGDGDNVILVGELVNGSVPVRIGLGTNNAAAGDTLTVNNVPITLTADQIAAGFVDISLPAPADGAQFVVSATLTDAAGNPSATTTVSALVDTDLLGAPTVTLGNGDAYINAAEVVGGTVSVSFNLAGTGAAAGDTLTVNNVATQLTAGDIAAGVVIRQVTAPPDGGTLSVTAVLTDADGRQSPPITVSAPVDTTPPFAPTATIGNGDGVVGPGEISGGTVAVRVSLAGTNAQAGDTLVVNGNTIVLSGTQITAQFVDVTLPVPANGQTLAVQTSLIDVAGNSSAISSVSALVDTVAPGQPIITIGNGDAFITAAEINGNLIEVVISLANTGAAAGDTLIVNNTAIELLPAMITAGTVTTTVAAPADGEPLLVQATLTDVAGNTSTTATFQALVDTTSPGIPSVTIGNGDPYVIASEVVGGLVTVRIGLNGTLAVAGDTLTVNGEITTLTATQIAAGEVILTIPAPASGTSLTVSANLTDAAGNSSLPQTVSAQVDTSTFGIPVITIGDGNAVIIASEVSGGQVAVRVGIAGTGAVAGDILTVNGQVITLDQTQIDAGQAIVNLTVPTDGSGLTVQASLSDIAGNASLPGVQSATVDIDVPTAPIVVLPDFINALAAAGGTVSVTINIANTGAAPGDTLIVNGTAIELSSQQITNGEVIATVPAAANGETLTVTAQLRDISGNLSQAATDTAIMDTAAPTLPTLTLGNGDLYLNLTDVSNGQAILRVNIATTGALENDSLVVNGGAPIVLDATAIGNGYIDVPLTVPASGTQFDVTATLIDQAGNPSPIAQVSATVDTIAPTVPGVTIGDGVYPLGIADVVNGRVPVSIALANTGAVAGDILTVNGQTIELTQDMIDDNLVVTSVPVPVNGGLVNVTASLTDVSGNASGPQTVSANVDLTAPGLPVVTLGDGNAFITAAELSNGLVPLRISLAGTGAQENDLLTVNGVTNPLTAQQIADGFVVLPVTVGAEGETMTVAVSLTDPAGNSSSLTVAAFVDTTAPGAPSVVLGDGSPEIIVTELVGGAVPVSINLAGTGAVAGDRLTVNGQTITLTQAQINQVVQLTVPALGDGAVLTVTATLTDAVGNVSDPGFASATMDTDILGAPTLTLGDGDGFINLSEVVNGTVEVRVGLVGTGAAVGDILTVGTEEITLTQTEIDNGFATTTVAVPPDGQVLNLTASFRDTNNVSSPIVSATAVVDTTPPNAVAVAIGDGNGFIVASEINAGRVAVTINLAATNAAVGEILTVNGNAITLAQADIDAGIVQVNLPAPANGQTLTVTAGLTDLAGNPSLPTVVNAVVDTTAPGLPVITLGNGDAFILPNEINGANEVQVSIALTGTGALPGDTLTINGVANVLTAQQVTDGVFTLLVPAVGDGFPVTVTATLTDAAGNTSPLASATATVDTTVPTAPGIVLGNGDGYITASEVINGRVTVTVDISGRGAAAGDRLLLNGTTTIVLTADDISAGTVVTTLAAPVTGQTLAVTAQIADTSGNVSAATAVSAIVDTIVPTAPALSLGNGGDAYINAAEIIAGRVAVSVNLAGTGAVAGDRLTVNGETIVLTQPQITAGTVATSVVAPATGNPLTVNAVLTDIAGNISPIATATALVDTVAPLQPGVTLGNGDAYINISEVTAGAVTISVNLAGTGAVAGDRLTINGVTTVISADQAAAGLLTTTIAAPASGTLLTVNATLTDVAGNVSQVTTATATVDTTPPVVPTVSFLNDTGAIGDGISADGTIRVTGIEPGARWEYSTNGGVTYTPGAGTGFTLAAGSYNVLVRQTDVAGNTSTRTVGPLTVINLAAVDDAATVALNITPTLTAQPRQTGSVGGILNLGLLNNAVDISLLSGQSPLRFAVAQNTTQQVVVRGGGAALASLSLIGEQNYDLLVYRVADGQTQGQLVHQLPDWLVYNPGVLGLLLPSWTGANTPLPPLEGGATYYVVLANPGGVLNLSALANLTVETTTNNLTDYRNVSGAVAGNVITGDATVPGTIVASVDQVAVGANGLVIHGDHGTLTIGRNGAYSYQADPLFTGVDGSEDSFTYTITSPDGSTSTAVLTITADYPHGPQALMSASIQDAGGDDMLMFSAAMDDDTLNLDAARMHLGSSDTFGLADDNVYSAEEHQLVHLMLDQGGQDIDLSGLGDGTEATASPLPASGPEVALEVDAAPTTLMPSEPMDDLPMAPFPTLVQHEDPLHASVI